MALDGVLVRCALGRSGVCLAADKQEGDGRTPAGAWPVRRLLWRPDRGTAPTSRLPVARIRPDDGWCDDPLQPDYNRPVRLPHPGSAERLWRDDHVYDLLVTLGYNDEPVVPGGGSAIFAHLARSDYAPTEGCVALARDDMLRFLRLAGEGDLIDVKPPGSRP